MKVISKEITTGCSSMSIVDCEERCLRPVFYSLIERFRNRKNDWYPIFIVISENPHVRVRCVGFADSKLSTRFLGRLHFVFQLDLTHTHHLVQCQHHWICCTAFVVGVVVAGVVVIAGIVTITISATYLLLQLNLLLLSSCVLRWLLLTDFFPIQFPSSILRNIFPPRYLNFFPRHLNVFHTLLLNRHAKSFLLIVSEFL